MSLSCLPLRHFFTFGNGRQFIVTVLIIWIIVTYHIIIMYRCNVQFDVIKKIKEKLKRKTIQLQMLEIRNKHLTSNLKQLGLNIAKDLTADTKNKIGPTEEYENLRRRIHTNTKELWSYLGYHFTELAGELSNYTKFDMFFTTTNERKRSLLSDQETLPLLDGHHEWRQSESIIVTEILQRRLHYLQNPSDCGTARKLLCNLKKYGFGSQLHHVAHCLSFGYAVNRTVVMNSSSWQYNANWTSYFHPISRCVCNHNETVADWTEFAEDEILNIPFIEDISPKPKFILPALPEDITHRVARFNGDPLSWWIGQLAMYALKPLAPLEKLVNDTIAKLNHKSPFVGVHIRRTDKIDAAEAVLHNVSEYMSQVDEYYAQLQLTRDVDERRVYLATDEPRVLEELQQMQRTTKHQYSFILDKSIIQSAAVAQRYTFQALVGLLVDLRVLAMSDYFVGTFSSNLGRLIYEMMQTNRVDATWSVASVDEVYYFSNVYAQDRIAVMSNSAGANNIISMEVGDQIGLVPGDHRDGYDLGTNKRTLINGLVPWYKTAEDPVLYIPPKYKEQ